MRGRTALGVAAAVAVCAFAAGLALGARGDDEPDPAGGAVETTRERAQSATGTAPPPEVALADGSVRAGRAPERGGEDCRRRALGSRGDLDAAGRRDFAPRCVVREVPRARALPAP